MESTNYVHPLACFESAKDYHRIIIVTSSVLISSDRFLSQLLNYFPTILQEIKRKDLFIAITTIFAASENVNFVAM
jgi:hypothetical protein